MKSQLMHMLSGDNDASAKLFARHLKEFLHLAPEARESILEALPDLALARTPSERGAIFENLAFRTRVRKELVTQSTSTLMYMFDAISSGVVPEEDSELWMTDFEKSGWVDKTSRAAMESAIRVLSGSRVSEVKRELKRRSTADKMSPVFTSCSTSVEMRAVLESTYEWGKPVDSYKPRVLDIIPIVTVNIGVDGKESSPVIYFQIDESGIDYMIAELQSAKKDIAALHEFLRRTSVKEQ